MIDKFMLQHNEEHKAEYCRDIILLCRDTNYCNMEKLVKTEEELRRKISVVTR